jgi:hypothetical protein
MVGVPGEEYFANADVGDGILLHGTAGGLSGAGSHRTARLLRAPAGPAPG